MTTEQRLSILEEDVRYLRETLIQAMANQTPVVGRVDSTSNKTDALSKDVESITPTNYIQTAYIGDTEVTFRDVKTGNITVYAEDSEGHHPNCTVERNTDSVSVHFEPLEYVTTVTISVV